MQFRVVGELTFDSLQMRDAKASDLLFFNFSLTPNAKQFYLLFYLMQ